MDRRVILPITLNQ